MTEQISAVSTAVKNNNPWKANDVGGATDPLSGDITVRVTEGTKKSIPSPANATATASRTPTKQVVKQQEDLIDWFLGGSSSSGGAGHPKPQPPIAVHAQPANREVSLLVSTRIMDVADILTTPRTSPSTAQLLTIEAMQQRLDEEEAIRYEAARRLRLLCDILAGYTAFQSYDKNIEAASLIHASSTSTDASPPSSDNPSPKPVATNLTTRSADDDPATDENASELRVWKTVPASTAASKLPEQDSSDDDLTEIVV
jgi:hypothetical protein